MNYEQQLQLRQAHIELARRHVTEAQERLAWLRVQVARTIAAGQDPTNGEKLVRSFEATLRNMREHLALEEGRHTPVPWKRYVGFSEADD